MAKSPSWLLSEDSTSLLWGKLLQGSMSSMITCSGVRVSWWLSSEKRRMEPWWSRELLSKKQGKNVRMTKLGAACLEPKLNPWKSLEIDELSLGNAMIKVGLRLQGSAGKPHDPDVFFGRNCLRVKCQTFLIFSLESWRQNFLPGIQVKENLHDSWWYLHISSHIFRKIGQLPCRSFSSCHGILHFPPVWVMHWQIALPDLVRSLNTA